MASVDRPFTVLDHGSRTAFGIDAPQVAAEAALRTVHTQILDDGTAVHSFRTLLTALSGIVRNVCRRQGAAADEPTFAMLATPNATQHRAYDLLETIAV
jgi:hypothetical protein